MRVLVTPTTSTQFNITGAATLSGTVTYVLAPGHYSPHIYPYLTATDGVTGEFTTVNYGEIPKGLAATQYVEDPVVQLVLSGSFNIPNIINPDDSTIFSAQTQALAQEADADTGALLQKAALGGAATSPACAAEAPLSPNKTGASGTGANMASALASVFCGAGGWIEATGSLGHADPSGGAPAYDANTAGFLAGVDKVVSPTGTRVGFAVGYDETYLSDKLGGGGRMGTTRVALYAAQPAGMFTLAGVLEYGNANNTTSRVSGDGNLSESNSVSIWSGGLQLSTDITMHGIDFVPAAGLRVASVGGGSHFAEGASGIAAAFAVSGKTTQYNSVQPYVLVEGKQTFLTASGMTVTPDAEIGYEYEAGTHGIVTTLYGADGTVFYTPHNDLDPSDALLSAGISVSKNNWSLFATYTAHVAANWDTQVGEAGLRITF
jgi:outer membrane autotransporter protein